MGLAASQARLLTITARLADNELRSQTINNAKMRLATQSAQASDEYVTALNNAQLMFSNTGTDGLTKKQALTFNALTQYSQYNNQYGLINSAGQILVSEEDAAIFKKYPKNLEGFLNAHGLRWETSFFHTLGEDGNEINLAERLTTFYKGDNSYIGNLLNKSNDELEQMYLDSLSQEASIEKLNYEIYAKRYYQQAVSMYENGVPEFRNDIMGDSTNNVSEETIAAVLKQWGTGNNASRIINELMKGTENPAGANTAQDTNGNTVAAYAFNAVKKYLTEQGIYNLYNFINSFRDEVYPGGNSTAAWYSGDVTVSGPEASNVDLTYYNKYTSFTTDPETGAKTYTYPDGTQGSSEYKNMGNYDIPQGQTYKCGEVTMVLNEPYAKTYADDPTNSKPLTFGTKSYIKVDADDWTYNNSTTHHDKTYKEELTGVPTDENALKKFMMDTMEKIKIKDSDGLGEGQHVGKAGEDGSLDVQDYYRCFQISKDLNGNKDYNKILLISIYDEPRTDMYNEFVKEYFNTLLNCNGYFNAAAYAADNTGNPTLGGYKDAKEKYDTLYNVPLESYDQLIDFEKLVKSGKYGTTDSFKSVLNSWLVDKMLDVLGEPKYAWIDINDPNNNGNADAKAQWYTNLFNRMQSGYKVLENGLAKSQEWLEHAFETGLVSMEQVDLSYNWVAMDYKSCSNIYEETDNSAMVAKAEAKYNRAMNDIKQKDSMFDLQLKNIDTEHSALQTEYDVVKNVMNKNIDRTMKFNQSA